MKRYEQTLDQYLNSRTGIDPLGILEISQQLLSAIEIIHTSG